jgi:4-alpha-glucanotransferase
MKFPRSSGLLLHPTSLPGPYGIGELGAAAFEFVDFLRRGGQRLWQVLPLGPTGYGDSPYQSFSAFAGNPLLIDLDSLLKAGYLKPEDLDTRPPFPEDRVDFGWVLQWKLPVLARAAERFHSAGREVDEFRSFESKHASWLDSFVDFMAAKQPFPESAQRYWQFEFFRQWSAVKRYANERGIRIMGDMPIYVAGDSSDVVSRPELFRHDFVAGVPPDYFSATGQLWGNPVYRWDAMEREGYDWWIDRFRHTLETVDLVRLDHFRGFEAYWQVPAGSATAQDGEWISGPGASLFAALEAKLGALPIVAENLGVITPAVEAIRHRFEFPGMSVLQFAFGTDPQAPTFRPHNYPREVVAYTGTHDNDTTVGWWNSSAAAGSTRSEDDIRKEREFTLNYLRTDGQEIHWAFIETVLASVADTVLIPLQDVLGLGTEARMNLPGKPDGNWQWRYRADTLNATQEQRLKGLAALYDR